MAEEELNHHNDVVEITMDAGSDADDEHLSPEHVNHEYVQHTLKGITHSFTLYDDTYLNYSLGFVNPKAFKLKFFKNKDSEQKCFNITYLDPRPERVVNIAWQWFVNALAAISWAFVIIYVGEYTGYSFAHDIMLPTGILLGTFGIICFMIFYYKTVDKVVYRSFIGQVPILELFHMPRNKAYNDFVDKFEEGIYNAQRGRTLTMRHRLAGELKRLRLMKDSGMIESGVYEQAREKIFDHKEYHV